MLHYQDPKDGQVYVFDEAPKPGTIRADLVLLTEKEVEALPPPPVFVPATVTPWQIRKALNQTPGLRATIEGFVAQQAQDVQDGWEFATEFRRDDPMLNALAPALGLDLDAIFVLAGSL